VRQSQISRKKGCLIAVIAIDFDNTLVFVKQPLEGAREAINVLREAGHKIIIHSCNREAWVKEVLDNNDMRYDRVHGNESKGKPLADIYVDDKGYHFPYNGSWNEQLPLVLAQIEGLDNRKW